MRHAHPTKGLAEQGSLFPLPASAHPALLLWDPQARLRMLAQNGVTKGRLPGRELLESDLLYIKGDSQRTAAADAVHCCITLPFNTR